MKHRKRAKRRKTDSPLLNAQQTADFFGVSLGTLAVWRNRGTPDIPFVKIGENVRYHRAELESWLATQRRTTTKKRRA